MPEQATNKTGSCNCGAVRYEISGPMRQVIGCHCNQCRKSTGHFVAATSVDLEHFKIVDDSGLHWFRSSDVAQRGFCRECGSNLFWVSPEYGAGISAGSLDKPSGTKLVRHIFVADKGDYYDLSDGLPQHESYPPDIEQPEA